MCWAGQRRTNRTTKIQGHAPPAPRELRSIVLETSAVETSAVRRRLAPSFKATIDSRRPLHGRRVFLRRARAALSRRERSPDVIRSSGRYAATAFSLVPPSKCRKGGPIFSNVASGPTNPTFSWGKIIATALQPLRCPQTPRRPTKWRTSFW